MASLGAEATFPSSKVSQPLQQSPEEASAGDFGYGEDLGVRGILGKRHWHYVYLVQHLQNTSSVVFDYGQIGTASRSRGSPLPRQPSPQHSAGFDPFRITILHLGEDVGPPHL